MKKYILFITLIILTSGCQNNTATNNNSTNTGNDSIAKTNSTGDETDKNNNKTNKSDKNNGKHDKSEGKSINSNNGNNGKDADEYYSSKPMTYSDLSEDVITQSEEDKQLEKDENKNEADANIIDEKESKYLSCKTINEAKYSSELNPNQRFGLGRGKLPFVGGFGEVSNNGRTSYGFDNPGEHVIVVMPPDNKKAESVYPEGIISIYCGDSKVFGIYIPKFKDSKGDGFVDAKGKKFNNGFFVGADGSTYYDKELTKLARKSE